jgi:hypothetical protein
MPVEATIQFWDQLHPTILGHEVPNTPEPNGGVAREARLRCFLLALCDEKRYRGVLRQFLPRLGSGEVAVGPQPRWLGVFPLLGSSRTEALRDTFIVETDPIHLPDRLSGEVGVWDEKPGGVDFAEFEDLRGGEISPFEAFRVFDCETRGSKMVFNGHSTPVAMEKRYTALQGVVEGGWARLEGLAQPPSEHIRGGFQRQIWSPHPPPIYSLLSIYIFISFAGVGRKGGWGGDQKITFWLHGKTKCKPCPCRGFRFQTGTP